MFNQKFNQIFITRIAPSPSGDRKYKELEQTKN